MSQMNWVEKKRDALMLSLLVGFAGMDPLRADVVVRWQAKFLKLLLQTVIVVMFYFFTQHLLKTYGFQWTITMLVFGCSVVLGKIYASVKLPD